MIDLFYLIKMIFRNSVFYKFRKIKDDSIFQEMTIEEAEKMLQIYCNVSDDSQKSSSFVNRWKNFKSNIQDGDKIYYFRSPSWTWESLCGRAGYSIYRNGEEIDSITTIMN